MAQTCKHCVDINVALNKPGLLHKVACIVSLLLEPFWGCCWGPRPNFHSNFSLPPSNEAGTKVPQRLLETPKTFPDLRASLASKRWVVLTNSFMINFQLKTDFLWRGVSEKAVIS